MKVDLAELAAPAHTAIVTQECQGAVAGVPTDYASAVVDNTLSLLATVTTTAELLDVWQQ